MAGALGRWLTQAAIVIGRWFFVYVLSHPGVVLGWLLQLRRLFRRKEFVMEKIGIENLEKVAKSLGNIGTQLDRAWADKQINLEDMDEGIAIVMELPQLATVKYSQLDDEVKDLDEEEKVRMSNTFKSAFDLKNDSVEQNIEEGLIIVLGVIRFVMIFIKKPVEAPAA